MAMKLENNKQNEALRPFKVEVLKLPNVATL